MSTTPANLSEAFVPSGARADLLAAIQAFAPELVAIRHALHRNPELGFEEIFTSELVAHELERCGVDHIERGVGKTGVVASIRGRTDSQGRTVGLRADMDALPMREDNEFAHRSSKPGLMHGCGHDGHTAMLLGAARWLATARDFDGTVQLIFQPGEEGFAGAQAMIEDGLFERFPCDAVFAMHNWPGLAPGRIAVRPGPMMAAADRVTITITGRGGHGAHAYLAIDPVVVAAHIITAAQSIVSRNVNPLDSAVVSLCSVQAGDPSAMSVIPHEARIVGTVRTFQRATQDLIEERLAAMAQAIAAGLGAQASVQYERLYPATVNSAPEAIFVQQVAAELVGPQHVVTDLPSSMGAEDFSFMLRERPGAYLRIGQGGAESGCFLHNTRYDFNDAILPLGAALHTHIARRWLGRT